MSKNLDMYKDFEEDDNPFVNPFDEQAEDDDVLNKHIPKFIKEGGLPEPEPSIAPVETHDSDKLTDTTSEVPSNNVEETPIESVTSVDNPSKDIYNIDDRIQEVKEKQKAFLDKYKLVVNVTNVCRQLPDGRILSSNSSKSGSSGSASASFQNRQRSLNNFRAGDVIMYLEVSTNLPTFRKKVNKNIIKSYKEFENFAIYLQDFRMNHFHVFFPPAIPLNKTSYGLNNTEDLIQCKLNFQKWFDQRVLTNVPLLKLEELSVFLESDFNSYIPMNGSINVNNNTTTSMTSANHSKESMNSNDTMVSPTEQLKRKTLKQLQPPFDPVEELAVFRPLIKNWRKDLQKFQTDMFKYCKHKQQLSTQETNLGRQFLAISDSTDLILKTSTNNGRPLSAADDPKNYHNMYKRVGKTLQTIGDLNSIMATFDMASLYDDLEWCGRDLYNVKEQLTNRHFLMREFKSVSLDIEKNEQHLKKIKLKREIDPLKVHELVKNIQRLKELQVFYKNKLQQLTNNLIIDKENVIKTWETNTLESLKNFALKNIEYERKKLNVLERVKNDVRKTDKLGGLSRLGRKNLEPYNPTIEERSIKNDDSWSGDKRAPHQDNLKGTLSQNATEIFEKEEKNKPEESNEQSEFNENNNYFCSLSTKKFAASLIGQN
mgnify:FL=1